MQMVTMVARGEGITQWWGIAKIRLDKYKWWTVHSTDTAYGYLYMLPRWYTQFLRYLDR